jgi:hypothetical protein
MDFKTGIRFPTWIQILAVRSIDETGVGVHRGSYPVSRKHLLPGWGGTAECEGDVSTQISTKVKKACSLAIILQYVSIA